MTSSKLQVSRVALALSYSVSFIYTACAVGYALWPEPAMRFLKVWFHGLAVENLQQGAEPFTIGIFLYGLAGVALSAYVGGLLFAYCYNWLGSEERVEFAQPKKSPIGSQPSTPVGQQPSQQGHSRHHAC